ncbi:MAG: hypothetical protein LKF75_02560 [Bacilli bacterium]|jgi:hypothetical protein|nr:hypothetical protein [Bacilli bacterium]MCH4228569.1 hypothetical protein [Bacilli bacterium]MCH4277903.1 hypothetical protein [Bacilli bacterium]MCI2055245.1 hypothetical protein [Bacilli bacterium]
MSKPLVLLSNEEIHEIVGKIIASPDFSTDGYTMMKVAPFASMSDVDKMLSAADEKGISFGGLYPFASSKAVASSALSSYKREDYGTFKKSFPFLAKDDIGSLIKDVYELDPDFMAKSEAGGMYLRSFMFHKDLMDLFFSMLESMPDEAYKFIGALEYDDWMRLDKECDEGKHEGFPWAKFKDYLNDEMIAKHVSKKDDASESL